MPSAQAVSAADMDSACHSQMNSWGAPEFPDREILPERGQGKMAKGKYYTPEFKEQAVKMMVVPGCTYDLLHAL